ncbi:Sensor protein ZraS [Aequorivita lipolytica]|nr:Sensor protein ZraS [Aequorivita lipolytica]
MLLALTFCSLFAGSLMAQQQVDATKQKANALKAQLNRATSDSSRARLATQLSTTYRLLIENDSCKKYASLAIPLTNKFTTINNNSSIATKHKMIRAKAIENLGSVLSYENTTLGLDTLNVALRLWQETGNKPGIAMAYFTLAQGYGYKGDNLQAIEYFNKSIKLFEETNNKYDKASALISLGLEKRYLGNYGDALESTLKSLQIAKEIRDTTLMTDALLANGFNYMLAKSYPEALQDQRKALELYKLTKDSVGIARTYNDMGVTDMFANKLDDALINYKKALALRKKLGDVSGIGYSYSYISRIYKMQGKFEEAITNTKEGIKYALQWGDIRFIIDGYLDAGDIYLELKDYENALTNYNTALDIAKENKAFNYQAISLMQIGKVHTNSGNTKKALVALQMAEQVVLPRDYKTRRSIYDRMKDTYVKDNDYENAFESQFKFQQMNDSVNAAEKAEKITALTQQVIYENKRALQKASQDKEIAIQQSQIKQQKLIRNISIGGLLIVIGFAFVFFMRFKEKRKLNVALEESLFDLKATQKQLIQSEKMASLGELTAGIAHEIQNPLNFVNNFSDMSNELLDEMEAELDKGDIEEAKTIMADIKQNLEKINHHGKRAEGIVKGMLQHSRKSTDEKEPTDINVLADEYLRLAYHGLRAKDKSFNATLKTNFDETIGKIEIVPQDIGRVILNLITNAFYAVNEKKLAVDKDLTGLDSYQPTVSVSTKKLNNKVEISVKDNGNGIPQQVLDKIFQPFFTTKPTGQGTGLGLSMSYDIITKAHGGELKVETKEGEGTEFIIRLPIN